jgi:1,4-alpha-glucan branching enzyme
LNDADLRALLEARHPYPFAVLGMHADGEGQLWVRALLPGATGVAVVETKTGRRLAALAQRDEAGFFEGSIPRRKNPFDYRLKVDWAHGATTLQADPYAIGPLLGDQDLHYFGEGTHLRPFEMLGAHPMTLGEGEHALQGVRFAVWAPNAKRVSVVGD